jgi:hypothetical protein
MGGAAPHLQRVRLQRVIVFFLLLRLLLVGCIPAAASPVAAARPVALAAPAAARHALTLLAG